MIHSFRHNHLEHMTSSSCNTWSNNKNILGISSLKKKYVLNTLKINK